MHVRKLIAGAATAAVALSTVALAAPAFAVYNPDPDDSIANPVTADLIGVGSDTSQNAVFRIAQAWNAQVPAPASRIATFAALSGGTIVLPTSEPNRPNGSGAGKGLLYGGGNNPDIDFARSSSGPSSAEVAAGLQFFPFALDTLKLAVSNSVASNAPATITPAQMVDIYEGDITNWSQIGGGNGVIAPKIPQPGSGTRSFFTDQLKAANGGVAVTLAGSVAEVQEHDDTEIKNNPNAVGPFSMGRAQLLGSTLRLTDGFSADRALYNVVRGVDVNDATILSVFGSEGFVCSAAAKPLIEAAGFKQLFTPSRGGVCGQPTQTATSNFTVAEVPTTTTVTVTSASASSAKIEAAVTAATSPSGTVAFYEGATLLQSGVPLVSGKATRIQPAAPGSHTYKAVFTPATNTAFGTSEGTGTGTVQKASSSITETFAKKVEKGKKAKGTVTVTLNGATSKASGQITVKEGKKTLATKTLANGSVTFKLPKLAVGKHTLVITWPGDANGTSSKLTFKIKVKAPQN